MDDDILAALMITPHSTIDERTIDITTIGARSGEPRRIEIVFHRVGDDIYLSGTPGPRAWYANLRANPSFTVHLKHGVRADVAAIGFPVLDPADRERILRPIVEHLNDPANPFGVHQPVSLEAWVAGSPLVRVDLAGR